MKLRSHYDNLKVARDAPAEVIRAAFRALSQRYHPDKHPGDPRAARIMSLINQSYAVLSDPDSRLRHDAWIALQEAGLRDEERPYASPQEGYQHEHQSYPGNQPRSPIEPPPERASREPLSPQAWRGLGVAVVGLVMVVVIWVPRLLERDVVSKPPSVVENNSLPTTGDRSAERWKVLGDEPAEPELDSSKITWNQAPEESSQRHSPAPRSGALVPFDPNGNPWPTAAANVLGLPRLNVRGYASVTIDNSRNRSDVFLKLMYRPGVQAQAVRHIFVPAGGKFTMSSVASGQYEIRYRNLQSGSIQRSDPFAVEQVETEEGISFTKATIALYEVPNGNFDTHPMSEKDF